MEQRFALGDTQAEQGRTVLELLAEAGCDLPAACGGKGGCGQCLVRLIEGGLTPLTDEEERLLGERATGGWRLACQARVKGKAVVAWDSPTKSSPKGFALTTRTFPLAPRVARQAVDPAPACTMDQRGDWERICAALGCKSAPDLWSCLGLTGLEHSPGSVELLTAHGEPLGLAPAGSILGAVFDLGTTTVVGGLVDLESGALLAVRSAFNAQRVYGADVLTRLEKACSEPRGGMELADRIRNQVRVLLRSLLAEVDAEEDRLADLVMVGNTAMEHLFFGLDVNGLAALPFVPLHQAGLYVPARALGLPAHPGARIFFAPNLAGFIGADTVACLVATDLANLPGSSLLIDLGTNGEMVLAHQGRLWACSTAAGPAFEGAEIGCGMAGLPGAIERVDLDGEDLRLGTIDGAAPRGICGSGLIDAVAVLLQAGAIDETGRICSDTDLPSGLAGRIRQGERGRDVFLARAGGYDLTLTQGDIRQVQLAKGAIATGVRLLGKAAGVQMENIDRVLLAGAFGMYVDAAKASRLGLLPGIPPERVQAVGNAAGEGARLMLTNAPCRAEAESLVGRVEVLELAADPEFQTIFAEEMLFGSE